MDCQIGILKFQKDNMDILEAIDVLVMQPDLKIQTNNELFDKMANLIIALEADNLTDRQLDKVLEIIEDFEDAEELEEEVKAKKETIGKKAYASKYYNQNKNKMKKKKKELERSITGKTRERMEPIYSKQRKSKTGRHKVSYNV